MLATGTRVTVQISAELKIADLIRRTRTQLNLTPAQSTNPRIALGSQQFGHSMTLGEAGVKTGSVLFFTYGGGGS